MGAGTLWIGLRGDLSALRKDVGEALGVLNDFAKKANGLSAKVMIAGGVIRGLKEIGSLVRGVADMGKAIGEMAEEGDRLGDIAGNFEQLGGTAGSLKEARNAVLGVVSSFDLMAIANKGLARHIPDFNKHFGKIADLAGRVAEATGVDTKQSINDLTEALAKGAAGPLRTFGFKLEGLKKGAETTTAALKQLPQVLQMYAPMADSAGQAFGALKASIEEAGGKVDIGINSSDTLRIAFRELATTMDRVDWQKFGEGLGSVIGYIGTCIAAWMPTIEKWISYIGEAADKYARISDKGKLAFNKDLEKELRQQLAEVDSWDANINDPARAAAEKKLIQDQLNDLSFSNMVDDALQNDIKGLKTEPKEGLIHGILFGNDGSGGDEAKKKIEELGKTWKKNFQDIRVSQLEDSIKDAIKKNDGTAYESLMKQFRDATSDGLKTSIDEALKSKVITPEQAEQYKNLMVEKAAKPFADELAEKTKAAFGESVEFWRKTFENAITGQTFDLKDMLKQLAVGFAADLAASLSGNLSLGIKSPQDLGGLFAKGISALFSEGLGDSLSGIGPVADGAKYAGALQGESAISTMMASAPMLGAALGTYAVMSFGQSVFNNPNQKYEQYGRDSKTNMAGRLQSAWSSGFISEIVLAVLSTRSGPQNQDYLELKAVLGELEEQIKKLGGLQMWQDGKLSTITDLKLGDGSRFDDPNWGSAFDKFTEGGKGAFMALGEAMQRLYGISDGLGSHIALVLGEALGGTLDNARLAVMQLGLSFDDLKKALLDAAFQGTMRWDEYAIHLSHLNEAYQPGLEAVGDLKGAWDEVLNSGGKGMATVKGILDLATEAEEKGAKTLDDMRTMLIAAGADPEQVDAILAAAKAQGIDTLEEWKNMSKETAGLIAGNAANMADSLKQSWESMGEQIDEINSKLESIPEEVTSRVKIEADIDDDLLALLDSGVLNGGSTSEGAGGSSDGGATPRSLTRGLTRSQTKRLRSTSVYTPRSTPRGMVNPETIRVGTQGVVINIDARGQDPGVEYRVARAVRAAEGRIASRVAKLTPGGY